MHHLLLGLRTPISNAGARRASGCGVSLIARVCERERIEGKGGQQAGDGMPQQLRCIIGF